MISYKFRLYPNKEQERKLEFALEICRQTYNSLLNELKKQAKIDRKEIQHKIVKLKQIKPELREVYSKVLQYECYRLFSNLRTLSRLKSKGRKVGKLRYKGKGWFKTITFNQSGFRLEHIYKKKGRLYLSKIGEIKIRLHRKVEGNIKQVIIKKQIDKWFVIIQTDYVRKIKGGNKILGIDLGIENFIVDSENNKIEHPKIFEKHLTKLKKAQRELSRKKKGSKNRKKVKMKVAKIYEKITNCRNDFLHKVSTSYIKKCKIIVLEDLNIKAMMMQKYYNAKNIADASWSKFILMLQYKAESAGIEVIKINPKNTTQKCSRCGKIVVKKLWDRKHKCPFCNLEIDRDYNSAINILNKFLGSGRTFVEKKPLPLSGQVSSMKQEAIS